MCAKNFTFVSFTRSVIFLLFFTQPLKFALETEAKWSVYLVSNWRSRTRSFTVAVLFRWRCGRQKTASLFSRWLDGSGFAAREACGSGFYRAIVEPDAATKRSEAGTRRSPRLACGPSNGTNGSRSVRRRRRRGTPSIEQRPHDRQC